MKFAAFEINDPSHVTYLLVTEYENVLYEKTLTELGKLELVSLLCQTKLWETGCGGAWWTPTLGKGWWGSPDLSIDLP